MLVYHAFKQFTRNNHQIPTLKSVLRICPLKNIIMTPVDDEDKTSALLQGTGSNYKSKAMIIKLNLSNAGSLTSLDLQVTYFGYLESIDIKTQKTAEMLFMCIRNCAGITDLTDMNLQPMALPIEINGQGMGTFGEFYIDTTLLHEA